MANRWKGNIIAAAATTSSGTDYTGKANGAWGLNSQLQQKQANLWARAVSAPSAPTIGTATAGNAQATVTFTAPSDNGGGAITSYTATSTPGSITGSSATSPITVTGLTNGTAYTFKVKATNSFGTSAESAASNSVTPTLTFKPIVYANYGMPVAIKFGSGGFGAFYSSPATTITDSLAVTFSTNSQYLLIGTRNTSPYVQVYSWSESGFGTLLASPSTPPTSNCYALVQSSNYLFLAQFSSPYLYMYNWNGNSIGSRLSNSNTPDTAINFAYTIAYNDVKNAVAIGFSTMQAFSTSASGIGTKYTAPTLPVGSAYYLKFSPDGNYLFVSTRNSSNPVIVYNWSTSGFGSKIADPATAIGAVAIGIILNSTSNRVILTGDSSPYVSAYEFSGGSWGTRFSAPSVLPTVTTSGVTFDGTQTSVVFTGGTSAGSIAYPFDNTTGFGTKFADHSSSIATTGTGSAITAGTI